MKWAKTLQTKNRQNVSSGPFSHDAAHINVSSNDNDINSNNDNNINDNNNNSH